MQEKSTNSTVSERFKEVIQRLNLSRKEISEEIGVRAQTIGDYCSAKARPSSKVLIVLAEKYGINLNWLLVGQGEMFSDPLKQDLKKEYIYFGDTLREILNDRNLSTTKDNFARVGGITRNELEAILSNKIPPPATALRKWAVRYRINLNFLIAQMGYPLLTKGQYEQRGPLTWLRERDGEWAYPEAARNPDYAETAEDCDSDFYDERRDDTLELLNQPPKSIPMVGLAECGIEGWSQRMQMAVSAPVPDFHEDMFAAMTVGDSMSPAGIMPGNIVFCDPRIKPRPGDIIYVEREYIKGEGDATVKIFQGIENDTLKLYGWLPKKSDGTQSDFCVKNPMKFVKTIAPVVMIRKKAE